MGLTSAIAAEGQSKRISCCHLDCTSSGGRMVNVDKDGAAAEVAATVVLLAALPLTASVPSRIGVKGAHHC